MNRYEIRVVGHPDARRAVALGADGCRHTPDGCSVLVFASIDRAATYGLLARLRDAGIELVTLALLPATGTGQADAAPGNEEADDTRLGSPPDDRDGTSDARYR